MARYKNFDTAIIFSTRCIESIRSMEELEKDFSFFEKHLKCSKVYLETHRDNMDISGGKLQQIKEFFERKGIDVAGAITTTFMKTLQNKPFIDETGVFGCGGTILERSGNMEEPVEKGTRRVWSPICYTDPASRQRLKKISEFTASLFDEFILDDFYFTNCTCPSCIEAKGDESWESFRLKLMTEVSQNLVVGPAKAVNPKVKVVIKYPNWNESYRGTGYNPETQPGIFDGVYTGTETRDTNHSFQHIPRYGSYSLLRWFENVKPGANGGGWIDTWGSIQNIGYYLEQAYLTYFAKGREMMLFCYSWLLDSVFVPPLGHELERLDAVIGEMGKPVGIPVYEPFHGHGEEHVYDYLGMLGIPLEPVPEFPGNAPMLLLTANSTVDGDVIEKTKAHLMKGGNICITSGFIRAMKGAGIEELTLAEYTGGKVVSKEYTVMEHSWGHIGDFTGREPVVLPVIKPFTNATECLISANKEDNNFPVFMQNGYGRGMIYTLTVPDDYADLYKYPSEVLNTLRKYLYSHLGLYIEGADKVGLFLYDNNTFVLESFRDFSCRIRIHLAGADKKLEDIRTGREIPALYRRENESVFEVGLEPIFYKAFRIQ